MVRVLHVIGSMTSGGAEAFIMNFYRHIDRSKVQFDFAVRTTEKCFYDDEIESLGGKIYRVPAFNGLNPISYKKAWEKFFTEHTEHQIVHGHIGSCAALYLSVAKKFGKVTIAHSHNTKPQGIGFSIRELVWRFWSYPTRNIADYLFACTSQAAVDRFGKKKEVTLIKYAIDIDRFLYNEEKRNSIRKELNTSDDFLIGHVGRFTEQKNHPFLIDVFKKVHEKEPKSKLLLIGIGESMDEIKEKVEKLGLTDSIIFQGAVKNVNDYYNAMDIFAFPSLFEGFGIVLLEAQTASCYCITSDTVPRSTDMGLDLISYLPTKDAELWADKILEHNTNYYRGDTSEKISAAGYDIKKEVKWLEKFYIEKSKQ